MPKAWSVAWSPCATSPSRPRRRMSRCTSSCAERDDRGARAGSRHTLVPRRRARTRAGLGARHRAVLDDPRHDRAAGHQDGVRRPSRARPGRLHLVVVGQQRAARGRAELGRRLCGGLHRCDARRARCLPTARAFGEVHDVLAAGGLSRDDHGATAQREPFARTNSQWRPAARGWMASPILNQGAIMTSLLVDGRPIEGDPGLPGRAGGLHRAAPAPRHHAVAARGVAGPPRQVPLEPGRPAAPPRGHRHQGARAAAPW